MVQKWMDRSGGPRRREASKKSGGMPYFAQCTKRNERWGVNTNGPDALYAEKKRSVVFVVLGLELHENLPLGAKKSAVRSRLECPNSGPGGGRS